MHHLLTVSLFTTRTAGHGKDNDFTFKPERAICSSGLKKKVVQCYKQCTYLTSHKSCYYEECCVGFQLHRSLIKSMFLGQPLEACAMFSTSFVETKLRAVVQTHVGVAEQAAGRFPQRRRVNSAQLLLREAEVAAHLGAGCHMGDVEAIFSSWVRTQKKENNGLTALCLYTL